MKQHKMPDMKEGNVNVTPLIDIVMCLIIFYMLVAKIGVNTGRMGRITLPHTVDGKAIRDPGNTINLNIEAEGQVPVIWAMDGNEMKRFLLSELIPFLQRVRGTNREFKAIIRSDRDTTYQIIEPVLLACARANVREYHFETKKGEAGSTPR